MRKLIKTRYTYYKSNHEDSGDDLYIEPFKLDLEEEVADKLLKEYFTPKYFIRPLTYFLNRIIKKDKSEFGTDEIINLLLKIKVIKKNDENN